MWSIEETLGQISFFSIPQIGIGDVVDILLVAFLIYKVLTWIKDTRTWALLKGVIVVIAVAIIAYFFQLNTVWWLISNAITLGMIAVLVLFQPELRRALEQIGQGKFLGTFIGGEQTDTIAISDETVDAIIKSCTQMSKTKTGALIVLERETKLGDIERTGIPIDAVVSSQLLINIFEKNTPLHDGAIIIKTNRIAAATCFLPLSDSLDLSKDLGMRHRAAIGISEGTDAIVLDVSEETGSISYIRNGNIRRNTDVETLKRILEVAQGKKKKKTERKILLWKGRQKNE